MKHVIASIALVGLSLPGLCADTDRFSLARRLPGGPVIRAEMLPGKDGANINGPSLIRAPSWLTNCLGACYLYFAHQ